MELKGTKITKWHYVGWAFLVGTGLLIYISPSEEISPKKEAQKDVSVMAFVMCKNLVKEKLISPATADFPFLDRETYNKGNQKYLIRSYVDSQNGNGALIRTNWNCEIKYNGTGATENPNSWSSELEFF